MSSNANKAKKKDGENQHPNEEAHLSPPCCSFMATRELVANDKKAYVRRSFKELVLYMLYVVFTCFAAYGVYDQSSYYITRVLSSIFVDVPICDKFESRQAGGLSIAVLSCLNRDIKFRTITSQNDAITYLNTTLMWALFWNVTTLGRDLTDEELGFISYENELLGLVQFRQVRVRNSSCTVHPYFKSYVSDCVAGYSSISESTDSYGPENSFVYKSATELGGSSYQGHVTSYGGGGFVAYLSLKKNNSLSSSLVNDLLAKKWIDRMTRAVFVDLTVYNSKVSQLCVIRLVLEYTPVGSVLTTHSIRSFQLANYKTLSDYVCLICQVIFILLTGYYVVETVLEIITMRIRYWNQFSNYIDVLLIVVATIAILSQLARIFIISSSLKEHIMKNTDTFLNLYEYGVWQMVFNAVVAVTVMLVLLKLIKYMNISKSMTQMSTSLNRCAAELVGFTIMYCIVLLAFVQLGYLAFGPLCKEFRTFQDSIATLLRVLLSDCSFVNVSAASPTFGPIFLIVYVMTMYFILVHLFLSIVNSTYQTVKQETSFVESYHIVDFLKKFFRLSLPHSRKVLKAKEWKRHLAEMGHKETEIDDAFALNGGSREDMHEVSPAEQTKMLEDLKQQRLALAELEGIPGLTVIQRQFDMVQSTAGDMFTKVEQAVVNFRQSLIGRQRRELKMCQFVDAIAEAINSGDKAALDEVLETVKAEVNNV